MLIWITSCVVFLLVTDGSAQSYKPCVTPDRVNGLCKPIKSCESIINILQGTITPQIREFLQKSQCATGQQPWVCCPSASSQKNDGFQKGKLPKAPDCGIDSPNRIFGGEETKIDEYPWLVQLQYNKPGNKIGFNCGGSLINQRYVLTAAHCVKKVPATWKLVSVRLGEWDTLTNVDCDDSYTNEQVCNEPHVDILVEEKIVHEGYSSNSKNQHNDIALLRLSRSVEYTEFIRPICLPIDDEVKRYDLSGSALDVAGWGKTETSSSSTRKLKVAIRAYKNSECQSIYGKSQIEILDSQICAGGDPGRDSCNGDSGGPLMKYYSSGIPHYFLAGIVSYGPRNCGTPDIPGVYTRVSKYIDWIQNKIKA